MSDDSISRQSAIEALHVYFRDGFDEDRWWNSTHVLEAINGVPSAQSEIVRCKDCKHQVKEWREDERFKDNGYWVYGCEVISDVCGYWALFGHNDQFCSEAERREDG